MMNDSYARSERQLSAAARAMLSFTAAFTPGILLFGVLALKNGYLAAVSFALLVLFVIGCQKLELLRQLRTEAFGRGKKMTAVFALLFAACAPFFLSDDPYTLHILIMAGIYCILALGLNYQVGSAGIPNLGFAAFYAVGAYASSLLATAFHLPFFLTILIAPFIAAFFGLLVGFPALKTRAYHLALVSIAFGLVIYILLNNLEFTGGPNGVKDIPPPVLLGRSFIQPLILFGREFPMQLNFYFLTLVVLCVSLLIGNLLYNSKVGLFWNAIRDDEIASKCSGIDTSKAKLLAFAVGAFFAGIAGGLYAHYVGYISPENFTMNISLVVLGMVILGGMDNTAGVVAGAFILSIAPEKFRAFADYRMIATGLAILLMLYFRPKGLFPQKLRTYGFLPNKTVSGERRGDE